MQYHRIGKANPEDFLNEWLHSQPGDNPLLAVEFELSQFWLEQSNSCDLIAVYQSEGAGQPIRFLVQNADESTRKQVFEHSDDLDALAQRLGCDTFASDQVIALQPVHIAKPWGEEIWYTGMEDRGVARAGHSDRAVPLPWVLSVMPQRLCAQRQESLILLKILAPLPDEVYGDLYFELHQEKREVYVITHIDEQAWPGGEGAIRFGFSAAKRRQYGDDEAFKAGFLQAVSDYEAVRRQIDHLLDQRRQDEGLPDDVPLSAELSKRWIRDLPASLVAEEVSRRQEMDSFTAFLPLSVGDVVKVPTLTPHSLQHGVRAVEFQTPVYERLIVSFAQKVLTQDHWDTEQAADLMQLETPAQPGSEVLASGQGWREERIVDFSDFEVRRYRLEPGAHFDLSGKADYGVLMAIKGELPVGDDCSLLPEQAMLLPGDWPGMTLSNVSREEWIFLVAYPRS